MSQTANRSVILLSNIPHYHYLAQALWRSGWLRRYITSVAVEADRTLPAWLPRRVSQKLEGRRLPSMPGADVRGIWLPEILQRGLGGPRGDWVNNHIYDHAASRFIDHCETLHFVSSVGLYSARKGARRGARIVCDCRQEHPLFQRQIIAEEKERTGMGSSIRSAICDDKILAELNLADHIIVPSSYCAATYVRQGIAASKLIVLPYGVDQTHFRPKRRRKDKFRVLFVGSACLRKGVHYLIEAFEKLQLVNAELILVGTIAPEMTAFLRAHSSSYRHLGNVPKVELYRIYSEASVLVLPSIADAYPLVALEAMACGLPVIISENCGTKDLISDGKEGFVVPVRDPDAIQDRLLQMYLDPDRLAEMSQAALKKAAACGWETYMNGAIRIYDDLNGQQPGQKCG